MDTLVAWIMLACNFEDERITVAAQTQCMEYYVNCMVKPDKLENWSRREFEVCRKNKPQE